MYCIYLVRDLLIKFKNTQKTTIFLLLLITSSIFLSFTNGKGLVNMGKGEEIQYNTNVVITDVLIFDDQDDGDPGDIYCKAIVNDKEYETREIQANDDDLITFNAIVYHAWCSYLSINIEVLDADSGIRGDDDSLGSFSYNIVPINDSISRVLDFAKINVTISTSGLTTVKASINNNLIIVFSFLILSLFQIRKRKK